MRKYFKRVILSGTLWSLASAASAAPVPMPPGPTDEECAYARDILGESYAMELVSAIVTQAGGQCVVRLLFHTTSDYERYRDRRHQLGQASDEFRWRDSDDSSQGVRIITDVLVERDLALATP